MRGILNDIFSSKARAAIFEILFNKSESEAYLRELERNTNISTSSLRAELERLLKYDLIIARKDGNRLYYKANIIHPLYSVFTSLVEKTSGPQAKLHESIKDRNDIDIAFIFGSYAKGEEMAHSDIDLYILGSIDSMEISDFSYDIGKEVGREINYYNFTKTSFKRKVDEEISFILSLKDVMKIYLKGDDEQFQKLYK